MGVFPTYRKSDKLKLMWNSRHVLDYLFAYKDITLQRLFSRRESSPDLVNPPEFTKTFRMILFVKFTMMRALFRIDNELSYQ